MRPLHKRSRRLWISTTSYPWWTLAAFLPLSSQLPIVTSIITWSLARCRTAFFHVYYIRYALWAFPKASVLIMISGYFTCSFLILCINVYAILRISLFASLAVNFLFISGETSQPLACITKFSFYDHLENIYIYTNWRHHNTFINRTMYY